MFRYPANVIRACAWLALGAVLGAFVSIQLVRSGRLDTATAATAPATGDDLITRLEQEQAVLREGVDARRRVLEQLDGQAASRSAMLGQLESELLQARTASGLTALEGSGVAITMADGDRQLSAGEAAEAVIVHDYDVRDVVGALISAGAEAIAVNDERLIFQTSIYCVGSTIIVGDRRLSPPLRIVAIGDPDALLRVLNQDPELERLRGRAADRSVLLSYAAANNLRCPAYSGAMNPTYARAGD
ncbi:MAG: DUF881 domain-containing protein [Anaerolineae bacterium]